MNSPKRKREDEDVENESDKEEQENKKARVEGEKPLLEILIEDDREPEITIPPTLTQQIETDIGPLMPQDPSKPSPFFIKVFIFCHGGLNIKTKTPSKLNPPQGCTTQFCTPTHNTGLSTESFRYIQKFSDQDSAQYFVNLNVKYTYANAGSGVNMKFDVGTVYVGDVNLFFNTPGTYAGMPVALEKLNAKEMIDRDEDFVELHSKQVWPRPGLERYLSLEQKQSFSRVSFLDYAVGRPLTQKDKEEEYEKRFIHINGRVSLLVDKTYQTTSAEYKKIKGYQGIMRTFGKQIQSNHAFRITMVVGMLNKGRIVTKSYNLLPLYTGIPHEFLEAKQGLLDDLDESKELINRYFAKISKSYFEFKGEQYFEIKTRDILELLRGLFNLTRTRIEFYDKTCCNIQNVNLRAKDCLKNMLNISKLLEVVNTYLRSNDIAFGKRKSKRKKRKSKRKLKTPRKNKG